MNSVARGIDALGEVSVRIQPEESAVSQRINPQHGESARAPVYHGHGAETDIIVASAKAYLAALNRMLSTRSEGQAENGVQVV
mgnify:FL=1